jgi:hypothetical protein
MGKFGFVAWSVLVVIGFGFPGAVRGGVLSADWKSAGDNLLTRDQVSGFDWLDLTVTQDRSYNFVESQFGTGGLYEGFRHATRPELEAFLTSAGIPTIDWHSFENQVPVRDLIELVGATNPVGDMFFGPYAKGSFNGTDPFADGIHSVLFLQSPFRDPIIGYSNFTTGVVYDDSSDFWGGHWLVRENVAEPATVPEPGSLTLWMSAVACFGLVVWSKRKQPA